MKCLRDLRESNWICNGNELIWETLAVTNLPRLEMV